MADGLYGFRLRFRIEPSFIPSISASAASLNVSRVGAASAPLRTACLPSLRQLSAAARVGNVLRIGRFERLSKTAAWNVGWHEQTPASSHPRAEQLRAWRGSMPVT